MFPQRLMQLLLLRLLIGGLAITFAGRLNGDRLQTLFVKCCEKGKSWFNVSNTNQCHIFPPVQDMHDPQLLVCLTTMTQAVILIN